MPDSWEAGSGVGVSLSGSYRGPICPQPPSNSAATMASVAKVFCMSPVPVGKAGDYTVRGGWLVPADTKLVRNDASQYHWCHTRSEAGVIRLNRFCSLVLLALGLVAPTSFAYEPLYVKNLSPVTGLLGLPSQRYAGTESEGKLAVALHSSVANIYVLDTNSREYLNLDGETLRFALDLRYGLAKGWDMQLEIPWLEQSGGHLDRLIDDWHDLWGMSDGGRSQVGSSGRRLYRNIKELHLLD